MNKETGNWELSFGPLQHKGNIPIFLEAWKEQFQSQMLPRVSGCSIPVTQLIPQTLSSRCGGRKGKAGDGWDLSEILGAVREYT